MSWFKYGILSGKIAAKKAETLTNDWTDLVLREDTNNKGRFFHQGLPDGMYFVRLYNLGSYTDCYFLAKTGNGTTRIAGADYTMYLGTTQVYVKNPAGNYNYSPDLQVKRIM